MQYAELDAWLRLQMADGVGPISVRKLLAAFGTPRRILAQTESRLTEVVSPAQAAALRREPPGFSALLQATSEWLQADAAQRRILALDNPLYPQILLQTEDPPPLLYAMGLPRAWSENLLNNTPCLAVVGSRNPSPQGVAHARQFSQSLAQAGLCVVSGLALGVDAAAHRGAIDGAPAGALATVAVVGTGLDRVYPSQHRDLAHRIAEHGVLLSEFPLGTAPLASNFPRRNRIISGLARGTLVVEAALQSGSLITARLALEQGREVFAIPGSIHTVQSRGCHALIKQGAALVENVQDILLGLQWGNAAAAAVPAPEDVEFDTAAAPLGEDPPALGDEANVLLRELGYEPVGLDALQARTGLAVDALLAQLMALELQGQVARLPGGRFQRIAQA